MLLHLLESRRMRQNWKNSHFSSHFQLIIWIALPKWDANWWIFKAHAKNSYSYHSGNSYFVCFIAIICYNLEVCQLQMTSVSSKTWKTMIKINAVWKTYEKNRTLNVVVAHDCEAWTKCVESIILVVTTWTKFDVLSFNFLFLVCHRSKFDFK